MGGGAARLSLGSAGGGGAPSIHALHLRDSLIKKEKTVSLRLNEQQKKRQNMRDLFVQNFLKKYMQRMDQQAATAASNSALVARIISNEVELFMDREKGNGMNQKALRQLEKDIEQILYDDPRVGPLLGNQAPVRLSTIPRERDMSMQPVS